MKQTLLFSLIIILSLVGTVSAVSIGEFQQNKNLQIYQTCNNCTSCNFTRVMGLNNQTILYNLTAIQDGSYFYYNINGANFTTNGDYTYCYECGNSVEKETGCLGFRISYLGEQVNSQITSIYIISIIFLAFIFGLVLLLASRLPKKDAMDEEGIILQINMLKHLRPVLYAISYVIILIMVFVIGNMTLAYLPSSMLGDIFMRMFTIMFWMSCVMLPLWFIWIFVKVFQDKETRKMLERGVEFRGTP